MVKIQREVLDQLGFDLSNAVSEHAAAMKAHAKTVDVPRPVAHWLVEQIVSDGGKFSIVELPPPPAVEAELDEGVSDPVDFPEPPEGIDKPTAQNVYFQQMIREGTNLQAVGNLWKHDLTAKINIQSVGAVARELVRSGEAVAGDLYWLDPVKPFSWINAAYQSVPLDAQQMADLSATSAAWVDANARAAETLVNMRPIPDDFQSDKYWPVQPIQPAPVQQPVQVSMASLRLALIEADEEEAVEAVIRKIVDKRGKRLRRIWDGGGYVNRKRGEFAQFLKTEMGYSAQQVSDLFAAAGRFIA